MFLRTTHEWECAACMQKCFCVCNQFLTIQRRPRTFYKVLILPFIEPMNNEKLFHQYTSFSFYCYHKMYYMTQNWFKRIQNIMILPQSSWWKDCLVKTYLWRKKTNTNKPRCNQRSRTRGTCGKLIKSIKLHAIRNKTIIFSRSHGSFAVQRNNYTFVLKKKRSLYIQRATQKWTLVLSRKIPMKKPQPKDRTTARVRSSFASLPFPPCWSPLSSWSPVNFPSISLRLANSWRRRSYGSSDITIF